MPEWIHARAENILKKNPSMPKSEAFAIATQQSHVLGKSPDGYGTTKGREMAHRKFSTPADDQKTAHEKTALTVMELLGGAGAMGAAVGGGAGYHKGGAEGAGRGAAGAGIGAPVGAALGGIGGALADHALGTHGLGALGVLAGGVGGGVGGYKTMTHGVEKKSFDTLALAAMRDEYQKMADSTFTVSQYAGPMGTVPFQQASQIPAFRTPGLRTAIEKPQQKIAKHLLSSKALSASSTSGDVYYGAIPEEKEAAALRSGKLPAVFKKEKGVIGRAKQLLSGERSLALKTYKERYENQAGHLARKAEAHAKHNSPPEYVGALKRDAEITGRAAGRIGKIHSAEAAKSTAARAGVAGAAAGAGFGAGRVSAGDEKEAAALTPAGRLVSTQRKGTGMGASVTGPSIAEVAKPPRMGHAIPGALKNQI